MDVKKLSVVVPVSDELLNDVGRWLDVPADFLRPPTPEERARREAADAATRARRAAEREQSTPADLTVGALLAKTGWSREWAEHAVQPYCTCAEDRDGGWYLCPHAEDLGVAP